MDEGLVVAGRSACTIRLRISNDTSWHPLLAMKLSVALLGDDEWAFRLPVLAFGIVILPLTYWVGHYDRAA